MASKGQHESAWARKMSMREQFTVTKRIFSFAKPYWKTFLVAILFTSVTVAVSVIMPRVIQTFIDDHLTHLDVTVQIATTFALTYGFLLLLQGVSNYLSTYLFNMAAEKTVENVRDTIFTKINTLGMRYFDQTPGGSIVSRVTNDTETLKNFWNTFYALFEGLVTVISVFIGMYLMNPSMAKLFLIFVPIMIGIIWYYQSYSSQVYRSMRENLSRLNTKINESILGMNVIQHFRQEKRIISEFDEQNEKHFGARYEMVKMNALLLMSVISLLEGLSLALVIYFLGRQYLNGILEVGVIYAFVQYSSQFFRPMGMMMDSLSLLQDGVVSSSRILRVLDHEEYVPEQIVHEDAKIKDAKIEFKNLTFSYDGNQNVLNNISFTVNPGETVAIVGHTGSGKSSIINVLMRFYEFQSGDVLIDGHSIREFPYEELRKDIGLVLQDSFLFYGDVNRNIRLLDHSISDRIIREAAHFVNANLFIEKHSDGYEHRVIERGASYSSGEKQLISFARTMARDPKILILDEATANIDTETEEYIQASLAKMRQNRTTIAIAHRLSTIRDANQIIVLDKGNIIEQGNHDELIEKKGTYYQMYRLQTKN
ncbi:MAG TPA: multidrug ABC transporter ATP-binding protein [Aerococcaceae bacterium]|nr:multidrug ABC transporter ATP-binding protein [Aerococcaceae bacterium]